LPANASFKAFWKHAADNVKMAKYKYKKSQQKEDE
jgi:hypothetical protein